jgi:uncharacterized protein with PIN domain
MRSRKNFLQSISCSKYFTAASRTIELDHSFFPVLFERQNRPALESAGSRTIFVIMVTARFRFDASLNDFLPRHRRHTEISCVCARAATVKHMVEALGVPHTEVTRVLVNGESCGLDRLLHEGDRVVAYPPSTACNACGPRQRQALPPGHPRFIADAHLGGLARMLRMAGFDTLYDNHADDAQIAALASEQGRIVLTRDRDLLKRGIVEHGCYVRALKAPAQFAEVFERFGLQPHARPFTLCLHCNTPLHAQAWDSVQARLPPAVRASHTRFQACDRCQRVYWQGSHWARMCAALAAAGVK